jgi:hypothetical protein
MRRPWKLNTLTTAPKSAARAVTRTWLGVERSSSNSIQCQRPSGRAEHGEDVVAVAAVRPRPKTDSVHVSNILAKLGVATRVEAAAIAHRLGLG